MVKCIAVRCDSGYKKKLSSVRDGSVKKNHYFYVPKDKKEIKRWQKAILRDDIQVKAGHAVCEKHFASDDILHEKLITGPDGSVLGRVCIFFCL